jgi:hypothetical protein
LDPRCSPAMSRHLADETAICAQIRGRPGRRERLAQ